MHWLKERIRHTRRIARWGWFVIYEFGWIALYANVDLWVSNYGSERVKGYWQRVTHPHWGWKSWLIGALIIAILFLIEGSYRTHKETEDKSREKIRESEKNAEKLRKQVDGLNNAKPEVMAAVDCGGQMAMLNVTNNGAIADVWASLRIKGAVNGNRVDMFARWASQDGEKTRIAKGETRKLVLASLKLDYASRTSQWQIFCAGDSLQGRHMVLATYTHAIGVGHTVPDVHLYVKLFSDPDCTEVVRERHIVLHSSKAEELSD